VSDGFAKLLWQVARNLKLVCVCGVHELTYIVNKHLREAWHKLRAWCWCQDAKELEHWRTESREAGPWAGLSLNNSFSTWGGLNVCKTEETPPAPRARSKRPCWKSTKSAQSIRSIQAWKSQNEMSTRMYLKLDINEMSTKMYFKLDLSNARSSCKMNRGKICSWKALCGTNEAKLLKQALRDRPCNDAASALYTHAWRSSKVSKFTTNVCGNKW